MKKILLFIVGLLVAGSSFASFPVSTLYTANAAAAGWDICQTPVVHSSASAACSVVSAGIVDCANAGSPAFVRSLTSATVSGSTCNFAYSVTQTSNGATSSTGGSFTISTNASTCPPNSTNSGGLCTCSAGYIESGSSCVAANEACAAKIGIPGVTNFTLGYTRTSSEDDYDMVGGPNQVPSNGQMCDGGCVVNRGAGLAAWRSLTPTAQGLYRASIDFETVPTGGTCTVATGDATNPLAPAPTCPGSVGEINGKTVCVGTAAQPVTTSKGSTGGVTAKPGNPAAGAKPSSGEGSGQTGAGRTPSTGSGGNAGGPASSAQGATGNVPSPTEGEEQAECGAPGQPKCRIDESGTPEPLEAMVFKAHADKYKTDQDAARGTIAGTSDKGFFSGWGSVFFLPPIATCAPIDMPFNRGSIDPCEVVEGTRSVMAWLWALAGLFLCVQMIRKVI